MFLALCITFLTLSIYAQDNAMRPQQADLRQADIHSSFSASSLHGAARSSSVGLERELLLADFDAQEIPAGSSHAEISALVGAYRVDVNFMMPFLTIDGINRLQEDDLKAHTVDQRLLLLQLTALSIKDAHGQPWHSSSLEKAFQVVFGVMGGLLPWIRYSECQHTFCGILSIPSALKTVSVKSMTAELLTLLSAYAGSLLGKTAYQKTQSYIHRREIQRQITVLERLLSHAGQPLVALPSGGLPSLLDGNSVTPEQPEQIDYLASIRTILEPLKADYPGLQVLFDR